MNPNIDKPLPPDLNTAVDLNKPATEAIEVTSVSPERSMPSEAVPAGAFAQQASSASPDPATIAIPTQRQVSSHQSSGAAQVPAPQQNDEDDMAIEKECVSKAKSIVERTSADPFTQTKEIGKVRAELLKRRYGKELKTDER
jgi:hypothetical protein